MMSEAQPIGKRKKGNSIKYLPKLLAQSESAFSKEAP
jgi:hypothetical protein